MKMDVIEEEKKHFYLKFAIVAISVILLCCIATFAFTAKHYQAKYDALNAEYTAFKAKYSTIEKEKEQAVIAQALAEKAAKTPLKEYIQGDTVTKFVYAEKESKDDATVEMNSTVNPIVVSYNGKKEELPTTTTEGKTIQDGKVVITQQTTSTLDIDSIVKREIANRILEDEHKQAVLKRQKTQQTGWGFVLGVVAGKLID
jgi:hypothetical protein